MTPTAREQLMILVERVVRPLRAVGRDKRPIREELWSHVTAVFEEELDRSKDEATALRQVQARLGEPKELTAQFQQGINGPSVFSYHFERWFNARPGESIYRTALRQGSVAAFLPGLMILMISLGSHDSRLDNLGCFIASVCIVAATIGVTLLFYAIRQAFFLSPIRSRLGGVLLLILATAISIAPVWLLYQRCASVLPPNFLLKAWIASAINCVLVPLLFIGAAARSSRSILESRAWENLQLD